MRNEFGKRLEKYRTERMMTKRELAEKLEITEQYCGAIERGVKKPSKNFMEKLIVLTELPYEYWMFGAEKEEDIINTREDMKCLKDAFEQLYEIGLLKDADNISDAVKEVLDAALLADLTHFIEKKKKGGN